MQFHVPNHSSDLVSQMSRMSFRHQDRELLGLLSTLNSYLLGSRNLENGQVVCLMLEHVDLLPVPRLAGAGDVEPSEVVEQL